MKKINSIKLLVLTLVLASCGAAEVNDLDAKKAELEKLRAESIELNSKISALESEIAALDPSALENTKKILIASETIKKNRFVHKVEVRGSVASRNNVSISAETMGRIEKVLVTEGQYVKKGTLLVQLDADIVANNISEVKTNLELAQAVFNRQAKLWEQNIGTEIQYLQAKANKEALEGRLASLNAQLAQAYVRAPFNGTVDAMYAKVGEMAQPGLPIAQIVGDENMYIKADVSEVFINAFNRNDVVDVNFPVQEKDFTSKVVAVGRVINNQNRTFGLEVSLPKSAGFEYRPNQVTILSLVDYSVEDAITVPTSVILTDDAGQFVYKVGSKDGEAVSEKVRVTVGKSYDSRTEILSGLSEGVEIISNGYRDVTDGSIVELATASL